MIPHALYAGTDGLDVIDVPSVTRRTGAAMPAADDLPDFAALLRRFDGIDLAEMNGVALLDRIDTKFMMTARQLHAALSAVGGQYRVLEIATARVHAYRTLYFDTPGLDLYLHHHAGRCNRVKVRSRQYLQSQAAFLEVKHKAKGRTQKFRVGTQDLITDLSAGDHEIVHRNVPGGLRLVPTMFNTFNRVTLVSRHSAERLTLDLDVSFTDCDNGGTASLSGLAIAEVKQGKRGQTSDFVAHMRAMSVRRASFSKYCMGVALLRDVKRNRFKRTLGLVGKLLDGAFAVPDVARPPAVA